MKFSLIVATKNRTQELERLFQSLTAQTSTDFEVIISDQNEDDRLAEILRRFEQKLKIKYTTSDSGISRARNAGIALAEGEILAFPDDDCAYAPDLLERVSAFFERHPETAYLNGRSMTDDGSDAIARHYDKTSRISREDIHRLCIEFAFFVRREKLGDLRFDELMGVGAPTPWQSDEGPDLMLRLEESGAHGFYDPAFGVWHPRSAALSAPNVLVRSYRYACGNGYFLRKHHYSVCFFAHRLFRTLGGVALALGSLQIKKARFYWERFRGLLVGWKGYSGNRSQSR